MSVPILLLIFPPAAWYIMLKNPEKYNNWFPKILLFYTIPTIIIFFVQILFLSSKLTFAATLPLYVGIIFYISQVIFSLILRNEIKNQSPEVKNLIPITVGVLGLDTVLPAIIYLFIFSPFKI